MGTSKDVEKSLLDSLKQSPKSKKELKKIIKAKDPSAKKQIKKALKIMRRRGEIEKQGNFYQLSTVKLHAKPALQAKQDGKVETLPIAVRLRKTKAEEEKKRGVRFAEEEADVDLDEEIRRLEQELQANDSEDDSESDGDGDEPGILSLSAFADDRVEHLPETYLPVAGRYDKNATGLPKVPKPSKREKEAMKIEQRQIQKKTDGLKEAVQEVLDGYKARSSERLPFYCRFCAKQYSNETEFFEHRQADFHRTAVEMERKATYCRLCLKQLTSPSQMKEHLKSRPHKERLENMRERQRAAKKEQKQRNPSDSRRQWC